MEWALTVGGARSLRIEAPHLLVQQLLRGPRTAPAAIAAGALLLAAASLLAPVAALALLLLLLLLLLALARLLGAARRVVP